MKTLLVMLGCCALAMGCQSSTLAPKAGAFHYHADLGEQPTAWGTMRVYQGVMPQQPGAVFRRGTPFRGPGRVVMDLLVDERGSVADMRAVEVSGGVDAEIAARAAFESTKYPVTLTSAAATRYVARQTVEFKPGNSTSSSHLVPTGYYPEPLMSSSGNVR